jgi:hypothetical protein
MDFTVPLLSCGTVQEGHDSHYFPKGGTTMKTSRLLSGLVVALLLLFSAVAGAFDTSPYVAGIYVDQNQSVAVASEFKILNPTTKPLQVYAGLFDTSGNFIQCRFDVIAPNGEANITFTPSSPLGVGVVKFFAFPNTYPVRFDPNAVVGGLQQRFYDPGIGLPNPVRKVLTVSNLKAVTINSLTLDEFKAAWMNTCTF